MYKVKPDNGYGNYHDCYYTELKNHPYAIYYSVYANSEELEIYDGDLEINEVKDLITEQPLDLFQLQARIIIRDSMLGLLAQCNE